MRILTAIIATLLIGSAACAAGMQNIGGVPGQWWSPMWAARWAGLIAGSFGALGGLLGALAGWLVWQNKVRHIVLGVWTAFLAISAVFLCVGIVALISGQPFWVYSPLLLAGSILTVVFGALLPMLRRGYNQAELQRPSTQNAGVTR